MSRQSARNRKEAQQKRWKGGFVPFPYAVLRSNEFARLTPYETKLLLDLLAQYNGKNNGDLSAPFEKGMRERGWKSKSTLYKAINGLKSKGFIIVTRQGGLHQCSLYATTFFSIDECGGKLEVKPTASPPGGWLLQARYIASPPAAPKHV
ncbi:MAG: hypothetical protein LBE75_02950 [Burkholderiales bacterium]|jgi:hypothetical protein|nr:hypothetical protein [Burkholderiales bacterium]